MMNYILSQDADFFKIYSSGFIWGKGDEWETFIPSVESDQLCEELASSIPSQARDDCEKQFLFWCDWREAYNSGYSQPMCPQMRI